MKRLISLFIFLSMLFGTFISCSPAKSGNDTNKDQGIESSGSPDDTSSSIVVPPFKDYGRGSINFEDIVYRKPNMDEIIGKIDAVALKISENSLSVEEEIALLRSLESDIENVNSMNALLRIHTYRDSSIENWANEYEYLTSYYPKFSQAIESLLVEAAKSPDKALLESGYFGYSLDKYVSGGKYTDALVELLTSEALLEAEYSSLSTRNIEISYQNIFDDFSSSGTADEVLKAMAEKYSSNPDKYKKEYIAIMQIYRQELLKKQTNLYIDLIKTRKLIADELGYDSYSTLAYEELGYDYSPSSMMKLLRDVGKYITPVSINLNDTIFDNFFTGLNDSGLDSITLINTLYDVYTSWDSSLGEIYSYMLQHKLYSIHGPETNRFGGAFTSYIESNNSPYLFMTTSENLYDYSTLAHEFGHFTDGYINNGESASLSMAEISSQGLELLTLIALEKKLGAKQYQYLEYKVIQSMLERSLMTQSFYSLFEHYVYKLDYDSITAANLNKIASRAFSMISGGSSAEGITLESVTIPHTVLYPHYVESYVTAGVTALDIFFMESDRTGTPGAGMSTYKKLIDRSGAHLTMSEYLTAAGLESPFTDGKLRELANELNCHILGKHYFKDSEELPGVA